MVQNYAYAYVDAGWEGGRTLALSYTQVAL